MQSFSSWPPPCQDLSWRNQTSSCRSSSASAYRLPSAAPATTRRGDAKISQFPMLDVRACLEVFDTAEPACPLPVAAQSVLPSAEVTASALRTRFTMLNALPTRAAVNASPTPSRQPAHDSRRSMNWLLLCSKGLSPSVHPPVSLAVPPPPRQCTPRSRPCGACAPACRPVNPPRSCARSAPGS